MKDSYVLCPRLQGGCRCHFRLSHPSLIQLQGAGDKCTMNLLGRRKVLISQEEGRHLGRFARNVQLAPPKLAHGLRVGDVLPKQRPPCSTKDAIGRPIARRGQLSTAVAHHKLRRPRLLKFHQLPLVEMSTDNSCNVGQGDSRLGQGISQLTLKGIELTTRALILDGPSPCQKLVAEHVDAYFCEGLLNSKYSKLCSRFKLPMAIVAPCF